MVLKIKRFAQLCIATALVLSFYSAQAQLAAWDSTYRPDIYLPQLNQFRSFPRTSNDIVFLGNSITHWTNWNELLGISSAKNRGIPGDITFGVIERLDEAVKGNPAQIFILIGINDIARNIPDSVILKNYQRIVTGIRQRSPATKIYIQTILPTNSDFKKLTGHYKNDRVIAVNKGIMQFSKQRDVNVVDLYSVFIDKENKLNADYTYDGVHLTATGYARWAEVIKRLLVDKL